MPGDVSRRRFLGYLIAAPMLVAAADLRAPAPADAAIPTVQPVDLFDLTDLLTDAALPTAGLITVTVNPDGTASFALPRAEVGQGITTAIAMVIADEMDLPLDKVDDHARRRAARAACSTSSPAGRTRCTRSTTRCAWRRPSPRASSTQAARQGLGAPALELTSSDGVITRARTDARPATARSRGAAAVGAARRGRRRS